MSKTNIRKNQSWAALTHEGVRHVLVVQHVTDTHVFLYNETLKARYCVPISSFEQGVRSGMFTLWVDLDRLAHVEQRDRDKERIKELAKAANDAEQREISLAKRLTEAHSLIEKLQRDRSDAYNKLAAKPAPSPSTPLAQYIFSK